MYIQIQSNVKLLWRLFENQLQVLSVYNVYMDKLHSISVENPVEKSIFQTDGKYSTMVSLFSLENPYVRNKITYKTIYSL